MKSPCFETTQVYAKAFAVHTGRRTRRVYPIITSLFLLTLCTVHELFTCDNYITKHTKLEILVESQASLLKGVCP